MTEMKSQRREREREREKDGGGEDADKHPERDQVKYEAGKQTGAPTNR